MKKTKTDMIKMYTIRPKHLDTRLRLAVKTLLFFLLVSFSNLGFSQVDVTASGGTANASYTTLKGAFDAINAGTHTGTISIAITGNTSESATASLNNSGNGSASYTGITISPSGGATRTISGTLVGLAVVELNGADNVVIDGKNTGGDSLVIVNLSNSGTANTSTIRFNNDASNNIVNRVTVLGASQTNTNNAGGNILVANSLASTGVGNDNVSITNCWIGPVSSSLLPSKGICSNNANASNEANCNSGLLIENNKIYDYFHANGQGSFGIQLGFGTASNTIRGNRLYQSATRTHITAAIHAAIHINSSLVNGCVIENNTVGYATAAGTGTYTFVGVANSRFLAVYIQSSNSAPSIPCTFNNNTITAINATGPMTGTGSTSSPFVAVTATTGVFAFTNNTIGGTSANNHIVFATTGSITAQVDAYGICVQQAPCTVVGNTIGGISFTTNSTNTTAGYGLFAIRYNGTQSGTHLIQNNIIGAPAAPLTLTSTNAVIQNIGILSTANSAQIIGNTVSYLYSSAPCNAANSGASVIGITTQTSNTSLLSHAIRGNQIYGLKNTNTSSAATVAGIVYAGTPIAWDYAFIEKNNIYGFSVANTITSSSIVGISFYLSNGNFTGVSARVANNFIALGNDIDGNTTGNCPIIGINESAINLHNQTYHNTVYIGGTSNGTIATATYAFRSVTTARFGRNVRNNIFVNARNSAGADPSRHYAIAIPDTGVSHAGLVCDYNLLYAPGTGGAVGQSSGGTLITTHITIGDWRTGTGLDINSQNGDPQFLSPALATPNLHINTVPGSLAESAGTLISEVPQDYDNQTRSSLSPVDIGADAFAGSAAVPLFTNNIYAPATPQCTAVNHTVSVDITIPNGTIDSAKLTPFFNGNAQATTSMTNVGNTWSGTINAANPANAIVTWAVTAYSGTVSSVLNGGSYRDNYLLSDSTVIAATPSTVCSGETSVLSVASKVSDSTVVQIGTFDLQIGSNDGNPVRSTSTAIVKTQILYRASELLAAGILPGKISSLTLYLAAPGGSTTLTVRMRHTTATATSTVYITGLSQVYSGTTNMALGSNTIYLNTPFEWDGVSNIVMDICCSAAGASIIYATNTPFTSCSATGNTGASGCDILINSVTLTRRPVIGFGCQKGQILTNSLTWNWTPGGMSGVSVNANPTVTTLYSVIGTDANGCTVDASTTVNVNPLPAAPSTIGSSQCGTKIPDATVSSTVPTAKFKWYDAPSAGNVKQFHVSATYQSLVTTTTTFYVSAVDSLTGCEGPRSPVTVTVSPSDSVAVAVSSGPYCPGVALNLTATQIGNNYVYTYSWTESSGGGLLSNSGTAVTANPVGAGLKTYTVTATDGTCSFVNSVSINLNDNPVLVSVTANPASICSGSSSVLTALSNTVKSGTKEMGTPVAAFGQSAISNPYKNTNSATSETRLQVLIKASELLAQGFQAGNLTSLGLTTSSAATYNLTNFTVKMAHTSATEINLTWLTPPFTTVFTAASYTPVNGLNTHTFSTPFNWDGTSNIVVEFCQLNKGSLSTFPNIAVIVENTSYLSCVGRDAVGACAATTPPTNHTQTLGGIVNGSRPLITLGSATVTKQIGNAQLNYSTFTADPYKNNGIGAPNGPQETKDQVLLRASELTARGFRAGNITSLGLTMYGITYPLTNFTIRFAHTNVTALDQIFQTPSFTTVFSLPSYSPTIGLNTHTFTTPFNWDGVSNILVQFCQLNPSTAITTISSGVLIENTSYVSCIQKDGLTGCSDPNGTNQNVNGVGFVRPLLTLTGQLNQPVTDALSYIWSAGASTQNPLTVSTSTTTTYTVTATAASGCTTQQSVTLTVNPQYTAPIANNNSRCGYGLTNVSVTSTSGQATPVFNWYLSPSDTAAIQSSASSTLTGYNVSATTTFYVGEKNTTTGCIGARVAVVQTVTPSDSVALTATDISLCPGETSLLTATQIGSTQNYTYTWSATPSATAGLSSNSGSSITVNPTLVDPAIPITYTYKVVATDATLGCGFSNTITVVKNVAPLSVKAGPDQAICQGNNISVGASSPSLIPALRFTEVLQFVNSGTNAPLTFPPYIQSWIGGNGVKHLLEISNLSAAPANLNGITVEFWGSFATTAPTATLAIPVNAPELQPGGVMYVSFAAPAVTDLVNNFYTIASGAQIDANIVGQGMVIKKGSIVIDAVGTNGYVFNASSGVTSADWSGPMPTNANLSGNIMFQADNNTGSSWTSTTGSTRGTLGALNAGLTTNLVPIGTINWTSDPIGFTSNSAVATFGPILDTTMFIASYNNGTCASFDTLVVTLESGVTPLIAAVEDTFCISGQVQINVTDYKSNYTYQWLTGPSSNGPWSVISGATAGTYTTTLNTTTGDSSVYYRVIGACSAFTAGDTSAAVKIFISHPVLSSANGATRCGYGSVTLTATAGAGQVIRWFNVAQAGTPIATGNSFTTPAINATTNYYAEARSGYGIDQVYNGPVPTAYATASNAGFQMTFTQNVLLNSVDVYSVGNGTVSLLLLNSDLLPVYVSGSFPVQALGAGIPQTIPLGWYIPAGIGYRLLITGNGADLMNSFSPAYPINLGSGLGTITSGVSSNGQLNNTTYYHMYNINLSTGCFSARVPVTATINPSPAVTLNASSTVICDGESVNLSASSSNDPNYTYVWNNGFTGAAQTVSPLTTTTYTLVATDNTAGPNAGCSNLQSVTVKVNARPLVPTITKNPAVTCAGVPVTLTATSSVPSQIVVAPATDTLLFLGYSPYFTAYEGSKIQYLIHASELTASGIIAGPLTGLAFSVVGAAGGTPQSAFQLKMKHTSSANLTVFETGLSTVYTAPTTVSTTAGWNNYNFQTPFIWDGTSNIIVEVCHNNDPDGTCINCGASANATVQSTHHTFTSTIGQYGNNTANTNPWDLCSQISTGANFSNTYRPVMRFNSGVDPNWLWSTGATSSSIIVTPPSSATYTVTAINYNGCTSSNSITVEPAPLPQPKVTPNDTTLCSGTVIKIAVRDTGFYSAGYPMGTLVDWVGIVSGQSPQDSINSDNGNTYQAVVTLPGGCSATSAVRTIITRSVSTTPVFYSPSCGQNNGKIVTSITAGTAPFRYVWKQGATVIRDITSSNTADSIMNLAPGLYTLEITDVYPGGCSSGILNYALTALDPLVAVINQTAPVSCNGESTATLLATYNGGGNAATYLWNTGSTSNILSAIGAGTYTVTVTDNTGCTDSETFTVTQPAVISAVFSPIPPCPASSNGSISAVISGGTTPYQIVEWYDAGLGFVGTGNSVSGLAAGDYILYVLDANNCEGILNVTLNNGVALDVVSFTPAIGPVGTVVTINGQGFSSVTGVSFNGTAAVTFNAVNDNVIHATVPSGATTGLITVTTTCGSDVSATPYTVGAASATMNLTVLLQGYFTGSSMNSVMMNQNVSVDPNVCDSITVMLLDPMSPSTTVHSNKVVLSINGLAQMTWPSSVIGQSYYIAVQHRNSVLTSSAMPVTFSSSTSYDFTTSAGAAFNNNQILVAPGKYAIYAGDINQDGFLGVDDVTIVDNANLAGIYDGLYVITDVNGDGFIGVDDVTIVDNNNLAGVISIMP